METWRRAAWIFALTLIAIFLQGTFLRVFLPVALIPNFLIILVVYLAFFDATAIGAIFVFSIGLLYDISSAQLLGPWAAAFIVVFGVLSSLSQRLFIESYVAAFLAVLLATVVGNSVYLGLFYQFESNVLITLWDSSLQGFVSSMVAPLVLKVYHKVLKRKEKNYSSRYYSPQL